MQIIVNQQTGRVTLIRADGEQREVPEGGDVAAEAEAFFGSIPAPIPQSVTARQARLALLGAGKLTVVEGALAQIPGAQGEAARIEWEYATDIRRDSPLIDALAPMLGLTSEQVDDLFRAAEGL